MQFNSERDERNAFSSHHPAIEFMRLCALALVVSLLSLAVAVAMFAVAVKLLLI